MSSHNHLSHSGEESLRVEEASHPEGEGAAVLQPDAVLLVALQQLRVPKAERRRLP